jgi:hypothetical protein
VGKKMAKLLLPLEKIIPHNHADMPSLISTEAIGVCILICINEAALATVYKSPGHIWNDAYITELLSF